MDKTDKGASRINKILVWLHNFRSIHHRLMAVFLENRGWVVFYLEEESRTCKADDFCWLKLYQQGKKI